MQRFLRWVLTLLSFGRRGRHSPSKPPPPPKTIVTLLIFPDVSDHVKKFDKTTEVGADKYYISSPWELSSGKVDDAIRAGEEWLAEALGTRVKWNPVRLINSKRGLSEWRSLKISLIKEEVDNLGLPWTDDHIYLAFVRGMGGYAGGLRYENGNAGSAMVGDVCLEALCEYPVPTAGSVLLGEAGWPTNSYSLTGQTGAVVHEALHGLDLPHPDGWPEGERPDWDETIMGHWWNMPNFGSTGGLTQMEIQRVLRWTASGG